MSNKSNDEKYPIHINSDKEFWGILNAMSTGSYTCLTNLTMKYTNVLYVSD